MEYRNGWVGLSSPMKMGIVMATLAGPAGAEQFNCRMDDGTSVRFSVDPALFVDAVSPEEPIRRKVTFVDLGGRRIPAEPFRMGDMRGFSAESLGGGTMLFVVQPDGTAVLSDHRVGLREGANCEVLQ